MITYLGLILLVAFIIFAIILGWRLIVFIALFLLVSYLVTLLVRYFRSKGLFKKKEKEPFDDVINVESKEIKSEKQ